MFASNPFTQWMRWMCLQVIPAVYWNFTFFKNSIFYFMLCQHCVYDVVKTTVLASRRPTCFGSHQKRLDISRLLVNTVSFLLSSQKWLEIVPELLKNDMVSHWQTLKRSLELRSLALQPSLLFSTTITCTSLYAMSGHQHVIWLWYDTFFRMDKTEWQKTLPASIFNSRYRIVIFLVVSFWETVKGIFTYTMQK